MLDASRVGAPQAGETVEQRGGAGTPRAEYRDALALLHLEARTLEHPDACGTSGDAGGVALPEGMGAKGERHDRTMCRALSEPTSRRGAPNELSAHSALRPMGPEAS